MNWDDWHSLKKGDAILVDSVTLIVDTIELDPSGKYIRKVTDDTGVASTFFDGAIKELTRFEVTVKDNRPFPEYKNTPIMALTRNTLNSYGLDWKECVAIVASLQEVIRDADYLMDDYGNSWARVQR